MTWSCILTSLSAGQQPLTQLILTWFLRLLEQRSIRIRLPGQSTSSEFCRRRHSALLVTSEVAFVWYRKNFIPNEVFLLSPMGSALSPVMTLPVDIFTHDTMEGRALKPRT